MYSNFINQFIQQEQKSYVIVDIWKSLYVDFFFSFTFNQSTKEINTIILHQSYTIIAPFFTRIVSKQTNATFFQ